MPNFSLVSIITPSYNCADYIGKTIESIQAQTYQDWELLITDDCSSDNSCEVIEKYMSTDPRIKLFRLEKNSGAGVARNKSIREAKGRFIAFCDSDDRWHPEKLERQLKFMTEGNYSLTYTSYYTCKEDGSLAGYVECLRRLTPMKILRDNGIGCLTAVYDAEKIGKHYMPAIRKRQDWCLWMSIIDQTRRAYGLQEPLAYYCLRKDSISSNKVEMLKYNFAVYHDVRGHNKLMSALILGGYFLPYYFYKKLCQKLSSRKRLSEK